ncbi:E3 ubiquitin-protein ligase RLIM-like [Triticum dicoccoides]|uniref:E3 ubiquitin-protein ligase RLIM-like n=1 Tax=Triticum dicoccoides TaxID=85692 RepID=UPI0018916DE2|nr:E3 ubiquitin-protein ligase RLIM-like [Triticum dicoccoides]XP_037452659.1 E3 ubiquitin-protein ligase RLIM-like [Triticum dicoccoides]
MEEYLSRRSKTAMGFLRRGSGINRSPEETTGQNTDVQGSTSRVNPMKTRLADNQERPRYLHGSYKYASSNVMSGSSSKFPKNFPLRKFGEEKRRQTLFDGADVAESSRRKSDARYLEGSKKLVVENQSSHAPQTETERLTAKDDELTAPDPEVSHSAGFSGMHARTAESLVRSASLSSCSSSFSNQPSIPRIPIAGVKPSNSLVSGEQRRGPRGLKNLSCTSVSDVLPSGCSSDSVRTSSFDAMRKRTSDGESSSRSRVISDPSSLGHSHTIYPSISGPRIRTTEESVRQQTLRSRSRNIQDSAVSVRTRRTSPRDTRFRLSEEREDAMFHLNESTAGNQQSVGADFSVEEDSSESSIRPVSVELPHAIYSSSRQGSSTRTARRTSSSRFEQSPPQTFRSLARERGGHRRINMEGIAEVLLVLERIEQEAELTYEQLRVLETNLLLGAFASHDQHSDMRMDIDNMSYEELLALEERIGYVSTALSEEQFAKCIRRRLYRPVAAKGNRSVIDDIKCSICQEEFVKSEEVGRLPCEHQYHVCCIRQWLLQKNWCPVCKTPALPSLN